MTIADRFVEPTRTDSAKIATSRVGSTSARIVISRLAPIPPNAVPVSMPASASATAPSASSATTANRSATGSRADAVVTNGATTATTSVVATSTVGAARNDLAGAAGRDRLLAEQLAQVPPRLPDPRPDPALQPGPDLAHQADQQRRQADDQDRLRSPRAEHGHRGTTSTTSRAHIA